jgi:hypothetical protein
MDFYSLTQQVSEIANRYVSEEMTATTCQALGIDPRSTYTIYCNEDCVAIPLHSRRTFDYYAGGEYVDASAVHAMGDYVFYSVADWLECESEG